MKRQTILTLLVVLLVVGMLVAIVNPVVAEFDEGQEFTVTSIDASQIDQEFTVTGIDASPLSTVAAEAGSDYEVVDHPEDDRIFVVLGVMDKMEAGEEYELTLEPATGDNGVIDSPAQNR